MKKEELIQLRLYNQRLSWTDIEKPCDVVAHLGAMQAQDYAMSMWAVGLRMTKANKQLITDQIKSGEIIRTHILRPTWHLVHQKDIRWMMELSAPYVKKTMQSVEKKEGLTDQLLLKAFRIIERQFRDTDNFTKKDIISVLSKHRIIVGDLLATIIIIRAELEMILSNGDLKGTYSLFDKKIPPGKKIKKAEAISRLTKIYFDSRGPATIKDFAWWSGLSVSDAVTGIESLERPLKVTTLNDLKYYYVDPESAWPAKSVTALLPCFDEYTVGYAEGRTIALPAKVENAETGNGIFKPLILSKNKITGTWRKINKPPFVETHVFTGLKPLPEKSIEKYIRQQICQFYL